MLLCQLGTPLWSLTLTLLDSFLGIPTKEALGCRPPYAYEDGRLVNYPQITAKISSLVAPFGMVYSFAQLGWNIDSSPPSFTSS